MLPVDAFRPALAKIIEVLRETGIRFHLTGGIISAIYTEPRFTQDADIVVDPLAMRENLESFLVLLKARQYLFDAPSIREAVANGRLFQLLDTEEILKIDVYPRELVPGELDRSVFKELFPGMEVPVVSRTDIAMAKLIWISRGSHKSRSDLRKILSRASETESKTVHEFAGTFSLLPLLEEVLGESDELPD